MTWGEIKEQVEAEGVRDQDEVASLSIQRNDDDLNAVPVGEGWIIEGVK